MKVAIHYLEPELVRDGTSRFRVLGAELAIARPKSREVIPKRQIEVLVIDYLNRRHMRVVVEQGRVVEVRTLDYQPAVNSDEIAEATKLAAAVPGLRKLARQRGVFVSPYAAGQREPGERCIGLYYLFTGRDGLAAILAAAEVDWLNRRCWRSVCLDRAQPRYLKEAHMANFGHYHLVSGAGWSVYWRVSQLHGSGLEVWFADFRGRRVMWRGSQPFAIVPYHRPIAGDPKPPHYTYKDGIGPQWGGVKFIALKKGAPNTWASPAHYAAVDTEAIEVNVEPSGNFGPASLTITAKFQCGWYQYVHCWEFDGDGNIHPHVAMGGQLNPNDPSKAHTHHMYFRVDLDIDGFSRDLFEEFEHHSYNDPGGDAWVTIGSQGKRLAAPDRARKWRVRDAASTSGLGEFRGYEIEIPQLVGRDGYWTGDIWATIYWGDSVQQGGTLELLPQRTKSSRRSTARVRSTQ